MVMETAGETTWLHPNEITAEMLSETSYTQACEWCYEQEADIDAAMCRIAEAVEQTLGRAITFANGEWASAVDSLTPEQRLAIWRACS